MSGVFDDRERAFESKYAHDQELRFIVQARANKRLAGWVAEQMGLERGPAAAYVQEVVEAGLRLKGAWDVVEKVMQDARQKGVVLEEMATRARYEEFYQESQAEIFQEA